jgi:hypothetical protein
MIRARIEARLVGRPAVLTDRLRAELADDQAAA